jgi:hypothetical protein
MKPGKSPILISPPQREMRTTSKTEHLKKALQQKRKLGVREQIYGKLLGDLREICRRVCAYGGRGVVHPRTFGRVEKIWSYCKHRD